MKANIRPLLLLVPVFLPALALAALPPCLEGFTLYSHTRTLLGDRDSLASGKSGSNGYTELGIDGKSRGDIVSRGNIRLRDRSWVIGNAIAGGTVSLLSGAQVTGTVSQGSSIPICSLPSETFSAGTTNHSIWAGNTLDLPPGSYGDVHVYGNGILVLHDGAYYFKSLKTEADGRLQLKPGTGTIEVFTSGSLAMGDRTQFNFTGGDAPQSVKFHSQQSTPLAIGSDILFKATVVAPLAEIHVFSRTRLLGSLFGNSIVCEPDVRFFNFPYDSGADLVEITSPADGFLTNQPIIDIAWTVNGTVQTSLTTENLTVEGANTVKRCSGTSCDSILVIRDQTPPAVFITSPADGTVTSQSAIAVDWAVDGVQQTTQISQSLTEGSNILVRTATEAAGNTGTASVTVIRDTQAPVVVISDPEPNRHFNSSQITVAWSVDGVAQSGETSQPLADEGLNWIVRASTDAAGNIGRDSISVFRDLVPPVVSILSPSPEQIFRTPTILVSWSLDGVIQTTETSETLQAGSNLIKRVGFDAAGNKDSASITVFLDTEEPQVEITYPLPGAFIKELSTAVAWKVDGVEQITDTSENLAVEGANSITRSATDAAGNIGSTSIQVIRDTQAPQVVITSPSDGDTVTGASIQVEYSVDGQAQTPYTYTLRGGVNTIITLQTDSAGNTGADTVLVFLEPCQYIANQTIHFTQPETRICLVVQNGGKVFAHKKLTMDSIRVEQGGQLFTDDTLQAGKVVIKTGGFVSHSAFTVSDTGYRVHIRAASITIDSAADINVNGKGYPVGRGPNGQVSTSINRGGVHAGSGNSSVSAMYGDHLAPVQAGSGGGNASDTISGGARGGGVVRLEADTLALRGRIQANGNSVFRGSGAGGSVWINAGHLSGAGTVAARGGMSGYYGGGGRIALFADSLPAALIQKVSAKGFGGGSIYLEDRIGSHELRIDSAINGSTTITSPLSDSLLRVRILDASSAFFTGDNRIMDLAWQTPLAKSYFPGKLDARKVSQTGGVLEIGDTSRIDTLLIDGTSQLSHPAGSLNFVKKVHVIADYIRLSSTSRIDVNGRGYPQGAGPNGQTSNRSQGGSHGGLGGSAFFPVYGSRTSPYTPGSGGYIYGSTFGGVGGGIVRLEAGKIDLHGNILANGGGSTNGAGAGGSIWVTADTVYGTGRITANGGTGLRGGGGRVAIYSCEVSEATRTSIEVTGQQSGTIHLPCHNGPLVKILSPAEGSIHYGDTLIVGWEVDGTRQDADTLAILQEGMNDIIRCHTNAYSKTNCDTITVRVDLNPPLVEILSPLDNSHTNVYPVPVRWSVDGVVQSTQTTHAPTQGLNVIVRSFTDSAGSKGSDSIRVTYDTRPPVIVPIRPAQSGIALESPVSIRWSVDSVEQPPLSQALDTSKANFIMLRATDSAGNKDSLYVNFYAGTLVPDLIGLSQASAESLLVAGSLLPDSVWVDNDGIPSGEVFSQTPAAGDTIRYHFPVRYLVSRGLDAKDLAPISLSVDSMTVNPNTLAAAGSVRLKAVNLGRTTVVDSFDIVVFEDRNLDGRYAPDEDLLLGQTGNILPLPTTDTLVLDIPVSGTLNFNGNRISVSLDHSGLIAETREENNSTNSMAACKKLPLAMDYSPQVKWQWRDATDPYAGVHVTPMIANFNDDNGDGLINADDVPDIIISTGTSPLGLGYILAVDGRNGQTLWKVLANHDGNADFAVGDIDGDGRPEIVIIQCGPYCWDSRLVVLDNLGATKSTGEWVNFNSVYFVPDGIALSDLDGDGKSEILWGENIHDHLARLVYPKVFDKTIKPLAAVDLDADGYKELIGSTNLPHDNINIRLGIINYKEKKLLRRSTLHSPPQYSILGKVENDSGPRLIRNTEYYKDTAVAAELFDMNLNRIKKYPGVLLQSNPPGVYDGNSPIQEFPFYFGTGSTRILMVLGSNFAHIPGTNSAVTQPYFSRLDLRDSSTAYRIFPQTGRPSGTVFDFNDDGIPEAVLMAQDTLYILDADGNTLGQYTMPTEGQGRKVTIADVDKDGRADIVVGISNPRSGAPGMMVFSNPTWVGARGIFNQLDYTVTNVDDDGRIPRFPTPHWEANNTANVQCATGNYACVDISASFPQITMDSANREQATARIGNGGAMELPAGVPVSVYATHLGVETLLTTLYTPTRLKPGQYYSAKAPLSEDMRGSYSFRFAADDSGNGHGNLDESSEANNTVAFTFLLNNQAPVVTQPANQYAEPGQGFDFQIQATDADGDTLSYALSRGPAGMSLNSLTGAIHWVPSQNPPRCTVEVAVSDPYQGSSGTSFLVYVGNNNNQPPVISSTPGTTAALNTLTSQTLSTYSYSIQAADPESEAPLEYELACLNCEGATGTTPNLEGNVILWRPFQPMWMPGDSVQLSLKAIDARGGITTQAWTIRLYRNGNAAPAFASTPNASATEDAPWRSPVTVFDLDGDDVSLLLDTVPPGMRFSHDSLRWTPATPGSYVVRIGASDGMDTTWQRFVLAVAPANDAPHIVSAPPTGAISGALYSYSAIATDEDGDAITYSLAQAPAGMTVSSLGVIHWRSSQSQTASVNVELVARDPSQAESRQAWIIGMFPDTLAPVVHIRFAKNPARPGSPVTVTVEAGDNVDVTGLTLTLDGSAVALTQGQYAFTPAEVGTRVFKATATDPSSNAGTVIGSLRVSNAAELTPPEVTISHSPLIPQAGQTVTFSVSATDTDGVDEDRLWVEVDGASIRVQNGQAQYLALRPGNLMARAVAFDSLGASALASVTFEVSPQGGDATAPMATITSPNVDSVVYGRIAILGTASDANLAYYTLSYRDINGSVLAEYARYTVNVVEDSLGFVDGTALPNGDYEVRLDVYDRSGNHTTRSVQVTVAGEKKIGAFTLAFEDLSIPMSGMDLAVVRTYDSRVKSPGDFGIGWRMGMRSITLHENRNQGVDWEIRRSPGLIPQYSIQDGKAHSVTVTLPGGRKQEFVPKPRFFNAFSPTYGVMEYEAKPGTYSRLKSIEVDTFVVMGGDFYDERGDFQEPFNPERYRIEMFDGSYFIYDQTSGGVVESRDANGNAVEWLGNAIRHNAGEALSFTRDSYNRITSISDNQGRGMQYRYDVLGNLHEVLDANGHSTRFRYGPGSYLEEVVDARGVRAARTEYDDDGRMVRQINALGDTLKLFHDLDGNTEEIEDFAGRITTYAYDDRGNVLAKTDPAGKTWSYAYDSIGNLLSTSLPGGNTRASTYDADGNELTTTDELGYTTTRTYDDGGRILTSRDPLGRTTTYDYDARGNLVTETGPDGIVQSERTFDSRGNMLTVENALGHITRYQYTSHGWLARTTDPLGRVTRFGHDDAGNVVMEVNPRGDTTRYKFDPTGNRLQAVNALGDTAKTEYNAIGKVVGEIDTRGHATRYIYNPLADKVQDVAADGSLVSRTYNAQGQVETITDPVGRITRMEYDHENRVTRTTFPDNTFTTQQYDALGRRTRTIDARGNATEYEFDAAGRNTFVRDALGHETRHEYDVGGRKTAFVDALSRRTEYEYDDYDRLVLTRFADGSTRTTGYDAAGRKERETDPAGKVTRFEYDAVGNLTAVVDALNHRTEYTYDANNNRLTQKDAENHTTVMAYDALNRMTTRTYSNGDAERWSHDANGNAIAYVKGGDSAAYHFDALNRETLVRHFPSGHEVRTTYTLDGKRDSVVDYRGLTLFEYDNRGRLSGEGMPNGDFIESDYDAQGNRVMLATPFGQTRYTFDALNRMDSVVAPSGNATRYFYNAVGNRDSVQHANGTATGFAFDALNRLLEVRNWSGSGLLSRFTYTLNAAGIRTAVTEIDGSRVDYAYDDLYRLTGETRAGSHAYSNTFTYDNVGNRLTHVKNGVTTVYAYNNRDQLTGETSPAGAVTYSYDAAGRQVSKSDGNGTVVQTWVDGDRLAAVTGPGVNSQYEYDADGRRVKETAGGQVRQYLIDRLLPFGQVILETGGTGDLKAEYVYGLDRVSQERDGKTHWYLADGQGSVRQLADSNGFVSDTYSYTAFGEPMVSTGTTVNAFRYVGEQADPNSGFYYLRARWMDPGTGHFISVDPHKGIDREPLTLHRYLYANQSPVSFDDPSGELVNLQSVTIGAATQGILRATNTLVRTTVIVGVFGVAQGTRTGDKARMRVQLQRGLHEDFGSKQVDAPSTRGVWVLEFEAMLRDFFYAKSQFVPGWMESEFLSATIQTGIWARSLPPNGIFKGGQVWQETFPLSLPESKRFRVDTENLAGHNLRR